MPYKVVNTTDKRKKGSKCGSFVCHPSALNNLQLKVIHRNKQDLILVCVMDCFLCCVLIHISFTTLPITNSSLHYTSIYNLNMDVSVMKC